MQKWIWMLLWLCCTIAVSAVPYEQVPNPIARGSYISDGPDLLQASAEQKLNKSIQALKQINGTQMALVIVSDCSGREPRDYAHRLFNFWGVGQRGLNNGVLFLVALQERRMEVATGDGVRHFLSDANLELMLKSEVVPHFKSGHPDEGVRVGVDWICRHLTPCHYQADQPISKLCQRIADPRPHGSLIADPDHLLKRDALDTLQAKLLPLISSHDIQIVTVLVSSAESTENLAQELARAWNTQGQDGLFVVSKKPANCSLFLSQEALSHYSPEQVATLKTQTLAAVEQWKLGAALNTLTTMLQSPLPPARRSPPPSTSQPAEPSRHQSWAWALALLATFGLVAGGYRYIRYRKRKCPKCQSPMLLLDEQADDAYLSQGERDEERLKSVDYDIWLCPNCEITQKGRYASWGSQFSTCPQCNHRTLSKTSQTLESPTESSEGQGVTHENCQSCRYHYKSYYSIARLTPQPSSDNSYSSGSDSSSSSSYDYSSSSSSDSSYGGGSSSDGGAGASW